MATEKQRREAARRQLQRQLQERAEREAARKRFTLIASIVGTLVIIVAVVVIVVVATSGNGNKKQPAAADNPVVSNTPSPSPSASATTSAAALPLGSCKFVAGGAAAKKVTVPADKASTKGSAVATVATTQGTMTFTLDRATAPCAVQNFLSLATQKYFDNTPCHRLTTSGIYVLQCGDPTGTGSGGPGYSFNDELSGSEKYTAGVLAMANSGANTNGSQFFIVYKDSTSLGANYTIFGKVTKGLSVVDKVAAKGSNNANGTGDGKPKLPIEIKSVTIAR
ncbi:MAG: peptidylprolyl isomerase [Jatrophihabitantaceae bacterium]